MTSKGGWPGEVSSYLYLNLKIFLTRVMVLCCWVVSLLLSLPQAIMFRKLKNPHLEFYQCTTMMVVETYSELVKEDNKLKFVFYGIDAVVIYNIYHFSFLFFVYFLPLLCLIISYIIIIKLIKRYYSILGVKVETFLRKAEACYIFS